MIGQDLACVISEAHQQSGRVIPLRKQRNSKAKDDHKLNQSSALIKKVNIVDFHLVSLSEILSKQLFLLDELLDFLPDVDGKAQLAVLVESTMEKLQRLDRTLNDQRNLVRAL
jgi:hypothetical protein